MQRPLAPDELESLRRQAPKIKRFVARHGEGSALIFAAALRASFSGPSQFTSFLLSQPPCNDAAEACLIVRALGYNSAALLPQLIASYFRTPRVDRTA
ncbi:MAG: hypothetical protein JO029_03960 [Candidatus Eremiobacteraeota bacterium]|nr:hypothetical protein [Candidatus Eremiobacteraeota bacterium]